MTIAPNLEAQILRYYHVEKWRAGTIARQLHVHAGTVRRRLMATFHSFARRWRSFRH